MFEQLLAHKDEIESQLGYELEWQRLDEKMASRIVVYKSGNIEKENERHELMEWLYQKACEFHKVFSPKIQNLK